MGHNAHYISSWGHHLVQPQCHFPSSAGFKLHMIKTLRPLILASLFLPFAMPGQAAPVNTSLPPKVQQALKANKLQDSALSR